MPSVTRLPEEEVERLRARLKRIEGQARGIQRMLDENRDCQEVLQQIAAIKAATNALSAQALETFALYCLRHPEDFASPDAAVEQAVRAVVRGG